MAKDFKLSLIYDHDDAIAIVLRPKCRSCADTALMLLLYKSAGNPGSVAIDHQPSNKMDNRIVPMAMMQLAIMNQRLAILDEENQPRRLSGFALGFFFLSPPHSPI